MILAAWFDHLEERFSYKEVQFKQFCPPVKTSCPPAVTINETPGLSIAEKIHFVFYFFRTKKLVEESNKHLRDIEDTLKVSVSVIKMVSKLMHIRLLLEKGDVCNFCQKSCYNIFLKDREYFMIMSVIIFYYFSFTL